MVASRNGDKEAVEKVLSDGADVNIQNEVCKIYDFILLYDTKCFFFFFGFHGMIFILTFIF